MYWASHLLPGRDTEVEWNNEVHRLLVCFAAEHLLNWMEAMSFIGHADVAFTSLEEAYNAMVCNAHAD